MKLKFKNFKFVMLILAFAAAMFAAVNFLGIGVRFSGTRIGYTGNNGWRSWSASYVMLNGTLKHTIHPKNVPETLLIEVVTEAGNISIEGKDADNNIVFDEDNIGTTTSFEVEVPGSVVVYIEAEEHRGSFSIEAKES